MKHEIHLRSIRKGKPFYVVAVCFVVDPSINKCLLLKRADTQMIHAGKWAPLGGKLEWSDLSERVPSRENGVVEDWLGIIEHLMQREAKEEADINVGNFQYISSVGYVRPDGMPSICLKFAAEYLDGKVTFPDDFSESRWFSFDEVLSDESILGVPEEVNRAIMCFS